MTQNSNMGHGSVDAEATPPATHPEWTQSRGGPQVSIYPTPTISKPSSDVLHAMLQAAVMDTQVGFEASDGCEVESDGTCHHGHPSWLKRYGLI
jgi:hypothetical protein